MSVTSSRLRHQGVPGLQAQKWASTENTSASASVTGTTLARVWPIISTISIGRLDMPQLPVSSRGAHLPRARVPESRPARQSRSFNLASSGKPVSAVADHPLLLAKRIGQLSADLGGDLLLIIHAVIIGHPVLRHPERAEQDVPERKRAGEIGVT